MPAEGSVGAIGVVELVELVHVQDEEKDWNILLRVEVYLELIRGGGVQ